jgi:hypothetical protein
MRVYAGSGDWHTIGTAEYDGNERRMPRIDTPQGSFAVIQVSADTTGRADGTLASVATDFRSDDAEVAVFAVDNAGEEVICDNAWGDQVGSFFATTYQFPVPADRLSAFAARVRPYDCKVTVKNLALAVGQATEPKFVVEKMERKN